MKFGLKSFLMCGFMALVFIVMMKVIFNKYPVAGVSDLVNAA